MYKHAYLGLVARIMTSNIGVKHADWWNQQYPHDPNDKNQHNIWARPAVFIEFMPSATHGVGRRRQQAELAFKLHLVTDNYSDPRSGSSTQNKALEHLDLVDKLFALIEGWNYKIEAPAASGNFFQIMNSVTRTDIAADHQQDNLIVTVQTFSCITFDYAAVKELTSQAVSFSLED